MSVERKRLQRMKRAGKQESSVETFETLVRNLLDHHFSINPHDK